MSTRSLGDSLELYAATVLGMELTYGSGASLDDADLKDDRFLGECKLRQKPGISIRAGVLTKVMKQATRWHRDWLLIHQQESGLKTVTLDLHDFAEIYKTYKHYLQLKLGNEDESREEGRNSGLSEKAED